jgi:predicted ester cyclase
MMNNHTGTPTNIHGENKVLVKDFLEAVFSGPEASPALDRYCAPNCVWEIAHPFNSLAHREVEQAFWAPLLQALPDAEFRCGVNIGGAYEGRDQVSVWGHVMGTFDSPWLGIPPTYGLVFLRFAFTAVVTEGRVAKAYILLDIIDLMRQAGYYPLRAMPGTAEQWPFPPCDTGAPASAVDATKGQRSLEIVREMQLALPPPNAYLEPGAKPARHSPHWHPNMNWYGPAGIGSMRGERGFRDCHGALFLQAFPNRQGIVRDHDGPEDGPGHYTRLGDGDYVVTAGWPSIRARHTGPEWLGLPPTGAQVEMRVGDWYRLDAEGRIIDNWVMIDVPHILSQMGLDIFHDLQFAVRRSLPRYPTQLELGQ